MNPKIETIGTIRLAIVQHRGSQSNLPVTITKLMEWAKTNHGDLKSDEGYGITYNNPNTVSESDFKFDLGIKIDDSTKIDDSNVIESSIEGGRYGIVRLEGSHDQLSQTVDNTLKNWLPGSGEELRDAPIFFQYQNYATDVAETDLITDIYFPLK